MDGNFTRRDILRMIKRYRSGQATAAEKEFLESYYDWYGRDNGKAPEMDERLESDIEAFLFAHIRKPKQVRLWPRIAAAASILLALSLGGYELFHKQAGLQTAQNRTHDIAPGGNKAILTLANGQQISITDAKNGNVARQANASISKTKNGQLIYSLVNNSAASGPVNSGAAEVAYNTVTTPVTGQHEVTLSDGTEVTLDAQSSITFPVAFSGRERKVSMTGQVYFKVKHDDRQPFLVSVKGQTIRDIGTEFNVNAYDDEPAIKTTLVSGSVKVNDRLLSPGEQAINQNQSITVEAADLDAVTAWKDGRFIFSDQDLKTTMRELARWYNVEVVYDNPPLSVHIDGIVSRSRNLSVVLAAMQQTGEVKLKLEGRKIIVSQ